MAEKGFFIEATLKLNAESSNSPFALSLLAAALNVIFTFSLLSHTISEPAGVDDSNFKLAFSLSGNAAKKSVAAPPP